MNIPAIRAIYRFEMARTFRTLTQSIVSPVLSTSLYFVVFGAAIGSRMGDIGGTSYGAFIIPGLIMLSLLNESISNASFGIYLPKWSGTIYELLSAPVSPFEAVLGYVGAASTKSVLLGVLILVTARLFVPYSIIHPLWMLAFLFLTAVTFSLFGFIIGLWADDFQKLQVIPLMVVTPLTFLGGAFYSIGIQSGGLSHQWIPLEFLWSFRCQRCRERRYDSAVSIAMRRGGRMDFPYWLQTSVVALPARHRSSDSQPIFAPVLPAERVRPCYCGST
jgi:ABC-2 type transport system permease protein